MSKDKVEVISIEELVEGNPIFRSNGVSYLKVTKDGKTVRYAIPIKSTGVAEAMESYRSKKPTPPIINKVVNPGDPAFKELGLSKKQHVKTYDITDSKYQDELEEYNSQLGLKIILLGLDIKMKDKSGKEVTDEDEKIKILKDLGLSSDHFSQIVEDITNLTRWNMEKEEDFL